MSTFSTQQLGLWCTLAFLLVGGSGCGGSATQTATQTDGDPSAQVPGDNATDFVSHIPGGASAGRSIEDADAGVNAAGGEGGDPSRAIAEADILKVVGDRLYALSRYAGLSVIDIREPSRLELLGSYRSGATPFEMYLEGGVAYIMYNDSTSYERDANTGEWRWVSTSRMSALDVSDPARITLIADHVVPGEIADSRLVGDILYLVTYENGYCYRCGRKPTTRVTSFDVGNRSEFRKVDGLRFEGEEQSWRRSISVTDQRIYVAGPTWADRDSTIQVVDISDVKGQLALGAEIAIHGSIQSRWQMDEHDGVLRVISQPTAWRDGDPPHVQTFEVKSAREVVALADLPVKLPRPETLQSVRFDGTRAYAVTFEQIDPLFTFDLSDAKAPRQMGELEIPGFVYHMEPRGDRIYALGYDRQFDDGALHVSIFDVSDLSQPTMLDRVNFGGDWANVREHQDRVHKAFSVLLDEGLILVPFGGGSWSEKDCRYDYQSGIQIIDVVADDLSLRGVASQLGSARRAFLHREHLFGITDNAVQVFDIRDRDRPVEGAKLEVARDISQVKVMGDKLLRFGVDWWTKRATLDFTALDAAGTAEPKGDLELSLDHDEDRCNSWGGWSDAAYVHGNVAYVPRRRWVWSERNSSSQHTLTFEIVDLSDRTRPVLVGELNVEGPEAGFLGGVVLTDRALLIGRGVGYYRYDPETGERAEPQYAYDVYDLANPRAPRHTARFDVPRLVSAGGWGYGVETCGTDMGWGWWFPGRHSTGALVSGDLVISQHEEELGDGTGRVRYYLDRLDVSDPSAPRLLEPINIPGQVVHFDGASSRVVTVDYLFEEHSTNDWSDCQERGLVAWFDSEEHVCRIYRRRLNALVLEGDEARRVSMLMIDDARPAGVLAVSNERVFYNTFDNGEQYGISPDMRVEALAYTADGGLERLPAATLERPVWWGSRIEARGKRAFMSLNGGLAVFDTADKDEPRVDFHELQGWGCEALEVSGDRAYCALGPFGVATLDLK